MGGSQLLVYSHLKYLSTCRLCQLNLLREDICQKKSTLSLQKEFSSLKVPLQNELNLIDFAHVSTVFFGINDKVLKSRSSVQQKMFYKLLQESKTEKDPEVIFNFSKYAPSDIEKKLLAKGLNFCLPLSNLSMLTIWSILNYFIEISVIQRFCLMRT